ncbi:serine aminopeptidase domain-containing protein [Sutterella wadsworthensis]|uniref:serine aminopeptidase domain-containing protein n=1 Tax=Sutterella wadsworthensis TaxID=40545 RepID=UPI003AB105A8
MTGELRQSVEAQLPDGMRILRRTLIGHSFGGLFTVNAVLTQPHAFDDFIAADPSFWWDQRRLIQKAAADGLGDKAATGPGRRLYLGFATKPRKDRTASADRPAAGARLSADPLVSDFIGKIQSQGMQVRRKDFPDEVHGTVMFPALFDALKHFYTRELS